MMIESTNLSSFRDALAGVLRRHRTEAGLTQGELGEKVGLSVGSISRIESGQQQVTVEGLQKLAGALGHSAPRIMLEVQRQQADLSAEERIQLDVAERMLDLLAAGPSAPRRSEGVTRGDG